MNRDEAMGKILRMLESDKLAQVLREHDTVTASAAAVPARRARKSSLRGRTHAHAHAKRAGLESLLLEFTPASAYAFVYERTVPPATEDGLALIAAYPELAMAAPELVADMAVAFRSLERDAYARYFARVALHHGIEAP